MIPICEFLPSSDPPTTSGYYVTTRFHESDFIRFYSSLDKSWSIGYETVNDALHPNTEFSLETPESLGICYWAPLPKGLPPDKPFSWKSLSFIKTCNAYYVVKDSKLSLLISDFEESKKKWCLITGYSYELLSPKEFYTVLKQFYEEEKPKKPMLKTAPLKKDKLSWIFIDGKLEKQEGKDDEKVAPWHKEMEDLAKQYGTLSKKATVNNVPIDQSWVTYTFPTPVTATTTKTITINPW